jgi:hypothetical protein
MLMILEVGLLAALPLKSYRQLNFFELRSSKSLFIYSYRACLTGFLAFSFSFRCCFSFDLRGDSTYWAAGASATFELSTQSEYSLIFSVISAVFRLMLLISFSMEAIFFFSSSYNRLRCNCSA